MFNSLKNTIYNINKNNAITNINKATTYLGIYGFIGGFTTYSCGEMSRSPGIIEIKSDTKKITKCFNILSQGLYGGVLWGTVFKTIPITLPSYIIYNIATTNKDKNTDDIIKKSIK